MKLVIQIVLLGIIGLLGYLAYDSIAEKIDFDENQQKRYNAVIQRLKDIRKAQLAYKEVKEEFAGNFDNLINFVATDSLRVTRKLGLLPDTLTEKMAVSIGLSVTKLEPGQTPEDVLAMGKLLRDTIKIPLVDTLYAGRKDFAADSMRYIPYSEGEEFRMAAGEIETGSGVIVKVFEVVATNRQILKGMDKNYYKPSEELRVGSLTEATNHAGNWGE